jgi:hypothetical protein
MNQPVIDLRKARETNEPECSHVKNFWETSYFNSLVIFPVLPYYTSVEMWRVEWGGGQRREGEASENSGGVRGECRPLTLTVR